MEKPIVSVAHDENIKNAVIKCLDSINLPDLNDKTILLKPNVGREAGSLLGINTNSEVVKVVFNYLKERFKARFLIGDSPIINTDTKKAFEQSGYSLLLKEEGLEFIDLDEPNPIEIDIPQGTVLKNIKLTGYLNEIDYLISIPVLKMHMHCGASLGFKNLKGLIYKREKTRLHHLQNPEAIEELKKKNKKIKELDVAIADLARVIKPDLVVIDGSYAMEGMGPSSGDQVRLDTIIASTHPIAADIVALALVQPDWNLSDVPHVEIISSRLNPSITSVKDIMTIPSDIQNFIHPIEPPPTTITIKYKNVHLVDVDSCSACLSTIFNLLKNNKDLIDTLFTTKSPLRLAIGKGIKDSDLYEDTYLIGNCTAMHKGKGCCFIKGCTPVESSIVKAIYDNVKLRKKKD
ncbi:MAG: DUF362 domain-containing protein [Candidatus Lokiarchaeota archaeon]|nr:DUF362 domain-containing protein [Candidatus Lokiarchaeota archaeon]